MIYYQRKLCGFVAAFVIISIMYYLSSFGAKTTTKKHQKLESKILQQPIPASEERFKFKGAKIVHVDLKGAPPKLSYFKVLFPLLSKMGATGLLMEYEDMFPYWGETIRNISALNAYTLDDIKTINALAKNANLEVIPLVQTFGHLQFVLKLKEFKDVREVSDYPSSICPTKDRTSLILNEMIDQVIEAHPDLKFFHIGADEVYYLGNCDTCTATMSSNNLTKRGLFLRHVRSVASRITSKYPGVGVLMWDDEFRTFSTNELKTSGVSEFVSPVVWNYQKDVYDEFGPSLWDTYSQAFPRVWVASAFKGATGSNQYVSDVTHYIENHRSWMSIVERYEKNIQFQGIIITGWQRYDHFAVLCELLPVAIPSLAMCLSTIKGDIVSPLKYPGEVARLLGCKQPYGLIGPAFGSPKCSYPGGEILENVLKLQQIKFEYEDYLGDSRAKGWITEYNINHGFSSPENVEVATKSFRNMLVDLNQVDYDISQAMHKVYDNFTIDEWKETYVAPVRAQILHVLHARDKLLAKDSWPRRPLIRNLKDAKEEL